MLKRTLLGLLAAASVAATVSVAGTAVATICFQNRVHDVVEACTDFGCEPYVEYRAARCCKGRESADYEFETPCPECCFEFSECYARESWYTDGDLCISDDDTCSDCEPV
jgi:hypothetical protein